MVKIEDKIKPKYRILMSSLDAWGHVNCTLGFGEVLAQAGHEVTFVHREFYRKLAEKRGFGFMPYHEQYFDQPRSFIGWILANLSKFHADSLTRYADWTPDDKEMYASVQEEYDMLSQAMARVLEEHGGSFDILITDFVTRFPATFYSPIPHIPLLSINPLCLYPKGPPPFSGYSPKTDKKMVEMFVKVYQDANSVFIKKLEKWWGDSGVAELPDSTFIDVPKHIGFYHYPEQLDYSNDCGPKNDSKWVRVDATIRQPDSESEFTVPESLVSLPGKLIYFSLGSLGSVDVDLMQKLIDILAKSPHRFIVSKGPRGDELTLAPNMWGENHVNQIAVLQAVDLVITHGGNNTFLETIFFGKPMIVIPFFFDQFDNAQRAVDCGIGRRLDTWNLQDELVLDTVEQVLVDEEMKKKIAAISNSMKSSTSQTKAVELIENFIAEYKSSTSSQGGAAGNAA